MPTIERYGHFIDSENCFELTSEPPRKWRNIHYTQWGGDEMYAEVSNIGDGFTRVRDAAGNVNRLVGWDAKYLYIRDDETNLTFNPWGAPCPQPTSDRSCRYYPEKTVISGMAGGLRATHRVFVPRQEPVEIWTLFIENLEDRPRLVSAFAFAQFDLTGSRADGVRVPSDCFSEVLPDCGGVLVTNRHHTCPTDRYKGYLIAAEGFTAGNGYRDQFTRSEYCLSTPRVLWGWNCDNKGYYGPDCAGVVQVTKTIPAKGSLRVDFVIGATSGAEELRRIRNRFTPLQIDAWLVEQETIERRNARAFRVDLGPEHANRSHLINLFVKKQTYSYLIEKSGFRDNLQIDNAIALYDYPTARANLLRALEHQMPNGAPIHSYRPLNRHLYSDKPAWILQTVPWLIKESGDLELLKQVVPYFESSEKGTVWDHIQRAYRYLAKDLGKHGLCDQHHADWNDQLEPTPETGARESVMVSQQLCAGVLEVAELAEQIDDSAAAAECRQIHASMSRKINDLAWDGAWYQRTICEDGYRLGSSKNAEARIFINTQSWAVLGQVAQGERARQCMESVDQLIERPFGFVICAPPLTNYDPRIGKYCYVMPGIVENGGCYCHAAGFKLVADCMLGRAEEALRTFLKVAPDYSENPVSNSGQEPFSFVNNFQMFAPVRGQAGLPWRTGTAGWFTVGLVEWILGTRRHYDGLLIDPCLSRTIPMASVSRMFRGAMFYIAIDNTAGRCRNPRQILLDGKPVKGNVLPPQPVGSEHRVQVVL
jgi:cellobiose phosphorylase